MASSADPWRILGLAPGATQDEIRRAYRRLAKVNHPDAAGEAALPRFLAIQTAYEQLAGPDRARRIGARPGSTGGPGTAQRQADAEREPWRADPGRAAASGRADGRRTPGARPSGAPGARARGDPGAAPASGGPAGSGPRSSARPGAGAGGSTSRGTATGTPRSSTGSGRRRPAKAGPGSTSYEGADKEPFEPGWSGATWYGASSGTYWTINPKEYADPRKHGPEYQARARRSRDGWILDETADETAEGATAADEPVVEDDPAGGDGPEGHSPGARTGEGLAGPSAAASNGPDSTARPASGLAGAGTTKRPGTRHATGGWASGPSASSTYGPGATTTAERPAGWDRDAATRGRGPGDSGGRPPGSGPRSWVEQSSGEGGIRGPVLRRPTTPAGRLAMALLGWPPLGVFAAAMIDQSTGCGRYAASCPELSAPGTWVVQAAILVLLLALPAVAAWSAHGAIATIIIGVPSAIVLSAAGGTNVRETSGPILLSVLAIAYLVGVAYAAVVGRRPGPV